MKRFAREGLALFVLVAVAGACLAALPSTTAGATQYLWVPQESGTSEVLHGVSGADANHVWAVGSGGTILFYDGTSWAPQENPGYIYYDVFALDRNHAWAVGYDGAAFFDGSSWEAQDIASNPLGGVWAAGSSQAWAVGGSGSIYSFDGSQWGLQYESPEIFSFEGIDGLSASKAWAVGGRRVENAFVGGMAAWDGSGWNPVDTGAESTLFDVTAVSARSLWAVGGGGEIRRFNGSNWSKQDSGTDVILYGVDALSSTKAFAVGESSTILSWNGSAWSPEQSSTGESTVLRDVFAVDEDHAWVVGEGGMILERQPTAPKPISPTSRTWGHDSIGTSEPATDWYLAEGCTATGFETWVLVQNPGDDAAMIEVTYMTPDGARQGPSEELPPNSRKTYDVSKTVPNSWEVSTKVHSDRPVVAERAMYGSGRAWGTDSIGASEPATTWYLAEGCTAGGFETWVLVQNPSDDSADVSLAYMTPQGSIPGPSMSLSPNSRQTFEVAKTVADNWEVSTLVTSKQPVVAERAVYWNGRKGAHDSTGVTAPDTTWYLAEGSTNGGFETWILVQNPGDGEASVDLTYMTENGEVSGPHLDLDPRSRQTVNVASTVPNTWSVSTKVTSKQPVIAERAVYWSNRLEGHDSIGTTSPARTWYLAEGSTGSGFETWVLVQNPNNTKAEVSLTYMTPSGPVGGPSETIPARSRMTFNVAETVPDVYEVSTKVTSNVPVISERAMYGDRN